MIKKELQNYMNQVWLLCYTDSTEKEKSYEKTQKDAPYYELS
jgi:hypothetical protein